MRIKVFALIAMLFLSLVKMEGATIPFRLIGKSIVIEATVNKVTGHFILDTGTPDLILNSRFFRGLPTGEKISGLFGREIEIYKTEADFSLGDLKWNRLEVILLPLEHLSRVMGITIRGLVGAKILNRYELTIDFDQSNLVLTKSTNKPEAGIRGPSPDAFFKFSFRGGIPVIEMQVGNEKMRFGLDARGHGRSDKPHTPDSYGIKMVHDVARLLDHLEIEQAHIVGYSMGGFIALKMATLYPERISSIVLGGAGWIDSQWDELGPAWENQASELAAAAGEAGDNDPLALAAVLKKEYELKVDEVALRDCTTPSLAIMGEKDFLRPGLDSLAVVMPHLKVEILPGEDHGTTYSAPAFATLVQKFLAKQQEE